MNFKIRNQQSEPKFKNNELNKNFKSQTISQTEKHDFSKTKEKHKTFKFYSTKSISIQNYKSDRFPKILKNRSKRKEYKIHANNTNSQTSHTNKINFEKRNQNDN